MFLVPRERDAASLSLSTTSSALRFDFRELLGHMILRRRRNETSFPPRRSLAFLFVSFRFVSAARDPLFITGAYSTFQPLPPPLLSLSLFLSRKRTRIYRPVLYPSNKRVSRKRLPTTNPLLVAKLLPLLRLGMLNKKRDET